MILHSQYTDGKIVVRLDDVMGDSCFVKIGGDYLHLSINNFLARYKLIRSI
jgi:hypothetical protein